MTFSEYFNALYPYLSDGDKPVDFFDKMIEHFIHVGALETCQLLDRPHDTKARYIKKSKPNKIKPEYAQYVYSKHNPQRYRQWLDTRMCAQDTHYKIEEWLNDKDIEFYDVCAACDDLLENIFLNIAHPENSDVKLPEKDMVEGSDTLQLSDNDKELLKDFHIDFDSILEKCVSSNEAEVWFTNSLATKVNGLYNEKWKNRISEFEDLGLQSDILSTIATLQDFCKALDPDSESIPGSSVRKLRIKLRDNYIKLHPDSYAGLFPYDAFIDDWNDENEFDM